MIIAVLALLIGRFEACVLFKAGATSAMIASWVLGGLVVVGFVLLWNTLLRSV